MDCRKCGAKHITRRRAGVWSCRHCGVQPGPMQLDRAGIPQEKAPQEKEELLAARSALGTDKTGG